MALVMKNSSKPAMLVAMAFASPIVNAQAYMGVSVGQSYFSNFKIDVDSSVMVRSQALNVSDNSVSR